MPESVTNRTWEAALGVLQLEVPKAEYLAWFQGAHLVQAHDGEIVVGVPTVFAKEIVDRRYRDVVTRAASKASGRDVAVTIVVSPAATPVTTPALADPQPKAPTSGPTVGLHPRLTFERFVVGTSNRLAHAAALRVCEAPGQVYNPLFLYSGVGLGKTHLLHAIGHAIAARNPAARVLYVPCETFTNDLLHSIRTEDRGARARRFRERYRSVDVLLIDDVEFLSRTETSQEEVFHTFNALYTRGRQIVLSSDQPPSEIPRLFARLRSRFESGLVADLQAPDLDLRRAILETLAASEGAHLPLELADFLAQRVRRNMRELEGALRRTLIYAELSGLPLTPETAASALDGLGAASHPRPVAARHVLDCTSAHFAVPIADLTGSRRDAPTARARQVAMYLLRNDSSLSLPEIGRTLGGRDHTTALHGCRKIERLLQLDDGLKNQIETIRAQLADIA